MAKRGEVKVMENKTYKSLDEWKKDFLPNVVSLSDLPSEIIDDDSTEVVRCDVLENGSLNLERLFDVAR